jgi:hypothetical protein
MFSEPGVSFIFLSSSSVSRRPLPSTGSLGLVPPLHRLLLGARTPGRSSGVASLPSLGPTTPCPFFAPNRAGHRAVGPGLDRLPAVLFGVETSGSPRFLGNPLVRMPRSLTPVGRTPGSAAPRFRRPPYRTASAALAIQRGAPTTFAISGLNHAACSLAVYSSQPGSPLDHARLASGWEPPLAGRDCYPQGPNVRFRPFAFSS